MSRFIQTAGTKFTRNGQTTRFTGTNSYYLGWVSPQQVDETLDAAKALGLDMIRTWGFLDELKEGVIYQSFENNAPVYHEEGLKKLDYVLDAASKRGLKLILPLVNNWKDLGGIPAYQSWLNLPKPEDFYADPRARQTYQAWCEHLITHVNTISGIAYKEDPTIFAWELTNEARCEGDPPRLLKWVDEMSRYIKTLDANHLLAVGDEGFFNRFFPFTQFYNGSHGADFDQFLQLDAIDFGTFHLYPWDQAETFGSEWIRDHAESGARWNKPVLLEEYGWLDQTARNDVYAKWLNTVREVDLAADMFWMLAMPGYYDDGFTFYPTTVPEAIRAHVAWSRSRSPELL